MLNLVQRCLEILQEHCQFNHLEKRMSKFTDLFFENVLRTPDKQAIWCDSKTVSYLELAKMVIGIANMLHANGLKKNDIIGIPMNNSIESVALFFAAAELGIALAPINPTLPIDAIKTAFDSVNISCIIARKSFYAHYKPEKSKICFCLDSDTVDGAVFFMRWKEYSTERKNISIEDDSTFILTLTSGSTGEPKPIELSQKNKIDRAFAHVKVYNLKESDRILAATPLYHSLAERLVIMPLLIGATAILLPRFTPNLWLNCIAEQKVTFTIAVSAQLSQVSQLLSSPFLPDIDSLRCLVSSSSLLESHVKKELINKLHCEFHEMYGTSEVSTVTDINFKETIEKTKSVGRCFECAKVKIVDENNNELPIGEVGEILCRSDLAFKGYYNLPDKTKASFTDNYFHTGDLGKVDKDGYLYFCGRKKELIITGGINVYPIDIENCLRKLNGVVECAAFSYPDERLGEIVAVAIVKQPDSNLSEKDVQFYCVKKLADFQQPHKIFFLSELPKNAMGKLIKGKLYEIVKQYGVM